MAKQRKKTGERKKESMKEDVSKKMVDPVKEMIGLAVYIVFLLAAVWLIITFVGQRTKVSGDSMYNTLKDGDNLWVNKLSYHFKEPERFDIVVFPMHDGEEYYIKRIIGLPGEAVRIDEEGNIYINDKILEEDYGYETISPDMIGRAGKSVILGEDEYFVMGDNRNESDDSRFEDVGNVERERLIGKAGFCIWPLSRFGKVE